MPTKQKMKKRIIKKPKRVKNKLTQNHSGVLLEEMNSKIDIILEGHTGLNKKIDTKIDGLREEMNSKFDNLHGEMNSRFDEVNSNFKTVFGYLSKIDDELQDIKSELAQIKSKLSKKSDLDYVKKLEQRMNKIEMDYVELKVMVMEKK
jgi:predicted  nucleic acid-binding Zn-ribbon protein